MVLRSRSCFGSKWQFKNDPNAKCVTVWINSGGCTSDWFCLSAVVLWMGGAEKMCPKWFTAVCGGRWAGSDRVVHAFLGSGTQTSALKCRHTAAVQAAAEHICWGQTPTCQQPSGFAVLRRIWICWKTSNIHAPRLQMCATFAKKKKQNKKTAAAQQAWLLVLCQLLPWCCPSSLQQEGAAALDPHQEKTEALHTEPYPVNQWPTNLHTPRDCFLSQLLLLW